MLVSMMMTENKNSKKYDLEHTSSQLPVKMREAWSQWIPVEQHVWNQRDSGELDGNCDEHAKEL